MQVKIDNINTDYISIGKGKTLVFLHGWSKGISKEKYQELLDLLSKNYHVIALDFPGFGKTDTPKTAWNIDDYSSFINSFLDKLKIKKCILLGHSFGGRITINIASQHNPKIEKIFLINSAGIERKSLKIKIISIVSKIIPSFIKKTLLTIFSSKDYKETDGVMRQIFKNVVNQNLENLLSKINVPTHIIWGQNDNTTPLFHAKIMNKQIINSTLDIVKEANHGLPYRQAKITYKLIKKYLQ